MLLRSFSALLTLLALGSPTAWSAPIPIQGYVGLPGKKSDGKTILVRTAKLDYTVDLSKVPAATKSLLLAADGLKTKTSVTLDSAAFTKKPPAQGIRPDCSELPLSYESLEAIAKRPDVKNQIDFLKAIPPGTLQTMTFAHKSGSAQAEGISKEFPGVFRMSADGKLVIRYTCDPDKPTYNTVEILRFNDATSTYEMADINFKNSATSRVTKNPKSCMTCHNPGGENAKPDPRPIWQQYDTWVGMYGSHDDKFTAQKNDADYLAIPELAGKVQERKDFLEFKNKQAQNPCYSTLPWPNDTGPDDLFPYSTDYKSENYRVRPNLKLTEIQAHLTAKRMARRIQSRPEYRYVKYALAMEAFGCSVTAVPDIEKVIREIKPIEPLKRSEFYEDPRRKKFVSPNQSKPSEPGSEGLFSFARASGVKDAEWTLHLDKSASPTYRAAIATDSSDPVSDHNISEVTQGILVQELSQNNPELKSLFHLSKGVQRSFGESFACIDSLGGRVEATPENQTKACALLAEKQKAELAALFSKPNAEDILKELAEKRVLACTDPSASTPLAEMPRQNITDIQGIGLENLNQIDRQAAARGKKLVEQKCIFCHTASESLPGNLSFFTNEKATRDHLKANSGFIRKVEGRLNDVQNPMPAFSAPLPDTQQDDIVEYLKSLSQ